MIWRLKNFLFIFNIFILIFVTESSVDSFYHQKLQHNEENYITNFTAINSLNNNTNINDDGNKISNELNKKINGNDNDNDSLNNIIKRRYDIIMNTRRINYHTLMNTFIYTFTLIPLLFTLARTFNNWPNGFIYLKRYKRSSFNEFIPSTTNNQRLSLLNYDDTKRFLSLLESTLQNKKILDANCRKYYSCKVILNAIKGNKFPRLSNFEWSILDILGIVTERFDYKLNFLNALKMYNEIVKNAINGLSCSQMYHCLQNHHHYHQNNNKDNKNKKQ